MQKQAPSPARLITMVLFALSCFGLLLFLWLSFGGPTPMKPKGYRFHIAFPEATNLAVEADVRVAGVEIGKVREKELTPNGTIAAVEIERKYAPVSQDARAVLRQKTLLGETYIELTLGDRDGPQIPEGGTLKPRRVAGTVQLDEILNTLDPYTRAAFRTWQQSAGAAVKGRGRDLNEAIGNLPEFAQSGGDLLAVLDAQKGALRGLVKNTGVVFGALTEREGQLRNLIRNSDTVFTAIQRERESFAEVWRIFPTFLDESRQTYARLERFARATEPLVRDMQPVLRDLGPTLEAVGDFAPDLRRFFIKLDPLITASKRSLPATRQIFDGLRPFLNELGPWLSELNPILAWLSQQEHTLTDMFANLGVATQAKTSSRDPRATGHYLRQYGPTGAETAAIHPRRLSSNRGNAYINPLAIVGPETGRRGILAAWDCVNAGGEKPATEGAQGTPACEVQDPYRFQGKLQRFPHVDREDYSKP